ncbi:hypothetical protein ACP4OV_028531 [Aristida adscensionis]
MQRRTMYSHPMASSSSRLPLLLLFLLAAAIAAPTAARAQEEYCRDTLAGLMDCKEFMFRGAPAPSAACCAAYGAAFDADPFCLCYVADGTYGRATGLDVNVTRALQIPAACGRAAPPVEICTMPGLELPPYEPRGSPAPSPAAAPAAQPPSGPVAPPSFTTPPPTSGGEHDCSSLQLIVLFAATAVAFICL